MTYMMLKIHVFYPSNNGLQSTDSTILSSSHFTIISILWTRFSTQ